MKFEENLNIDANWLKIIFHFVSIALTIANLLMFYNNRSVCQKMTDSQKSVKKFLMYYTQISVWGFLIYITIQNKPQDAITKILLILLSISAAASLMLGWNEDPDNPNRYRLIFDIMMNSIYLVFSLSCITKPLLSKVEHRPRYNKMKRKYGKFKEYKTSILNRLFGSDETKKMTETDGLGDIVSYLKYEDDKIKSKKRRQKEARDKLKKEQKRQLEKYNRDEEIRKKDRRLKELEEQAKKREQQDNESAYDRLKRYSGFLWGNSGGTPEDPEQDEIDRKRTTRRDPEFESWY